MIDVQQHCAELDRCNQRGGRMLSVFDLLEAKTLDLDMAACLMARISRGASFMVGARPGGAGKTTVMCALLNLVPADRNLYAASPQAVRDALKRPDDPPGCAICHEISPGHYFAYLWDDDLRDYCSLQDRGHTLATNLHADDLEEARQQVCVDNGVPPEHFNAFDLLIFLRVGGNPFRAQRRIDKVYASHGASPHHLIHDPSAPDLADADYLKRCRTFLEETHRAGVRTIEDARTAVVEFLKNSPPSESQ
jgi:hypothetical protein